MPRCKGREACDPELSPVPDLEIEVGWGGGNLVLQAILSKNINTQPGEKIVKVKSVNCVLKDPCAINLP